MSAGGNGRAGAVLASLGVRPRRVLGGLFLFSLLVYVALLAAPRIDGELIGSDGVAYYVYVRSLVIDRDLDFTNEYAHYRLAFKDPGRTPTGRPANQHAVGPALLWVPFFLAAHGLAALGAALGLGIVPDGYGHLYQAAISIGSIAYGALGFGLSYRCARRLFPEAAALAAVSLLWLASNAFYYMVFEPSMAHMVALFSVASLLSVWFLRLRGAHRPTFTDAGLMGAAGGLVLLVRLQDAPFLLLPFGHLLARLFGAWRAGQAGPARRWLLCGLFAAACAAVVWSPQLLVWQRLYGTWAALPYANDHVPAFDWLRPELGGVLFSTFHGLFTWHPIYLCALTGLLVVARRDRRLALSLAALLLLDIYLVAAWWAWWQGDSFGGRMFLSATWVWTLGLAGSIAWVGERRGWRAPAMALGLLLVTWNALALTQYRLGFVPMSAPLTWRQMTVERLALPWILARKLMRPG